MVLWCNGNTIRCQREVKGSIPFRTATCKLLGQARFMRDIGISIIVITYIIYGRVAERFIASVLKAEGEGKNFVRGFKSHPFRQKNFQRLYSGAKYVYNIWSKKQEVIQNDYITR